jgi:hypothetical protein
LVRTHQGRREPSTSARGCRDRDLATNQAQNLRLSPRLGVEVLAASRRIDPLANLVTPPREVTVEEVGEVTTARQRSSTVSIEEQLGLTGLRVTRHPVVEHEGQLRQAPRIGRSLVLAFELLRQQSLREASRELVDPVGDDPVVVTEARSQSV